MTLIKHTHKPSFPGIFDDFFMRNLFDDDFMTPMKNTVPAVNIVEHDESYEMAIAAPGMKKDDFNIELDNDTLVVSAEVKEGKKEDKGRFTRHEFSRSSFERRLCCPTVRTYKRSEPAMKMAY